MPVRIQRRRSKGWKMPANTIYVGRGSKWGNPFKIGVNSINDGWEINLSREAAVDCYRNWVTRSVNSLSPELLRGKNLACWCPLDQECHADVLLEIANEYPNTAENNSK